MEADQPHPASVTLLSLHLGGHRRGYIDLFGRTCEAAGLSWRLSRSWFDVIADAAPVLVLMIEESFVGYLLAGLIRAMRGRRTVGLLFRGSEAVKGVSTKMRIKRWVLRWLKGIAQINTLAITPFSVAPELEVVADGWIYDPQLWDLADGPPEASSALAGAVIEQAQGRKIVVALGDQGVEKGFGYFCRLWIDSPELRQRSFFVCAGKVEHALAGVAQEFAAAGGYLANRFISDDELISLYGACDVVWAHYAPTYDQASGIVGRALQLGRPVIVRTGSQMVRVADQLGFPVVQAPWNDSGGAIEAVSAAHPPFEPPLARLRQFRAQSLATLSRALGLTFRADS